MDVKKGQRPDMLRFAPPSIGEEEIAEVVDTLKSQWITTGPKVNRFEEQFADFVGAEDALALSSATDALLIALSVMGIGEGDEVITTPMTFCATAHVVEHAGARPVFVDVEPDTLNIDPHLVSRAVTRNTRAILPVHLYGHPCSMDEIQSLADRRRLHIIEDAAHALPAAFRGRTIGAIGDLTAFSFYATKNITTGEGGMLTGSSRLISEARSWSLHGINRDTLMRQGANGNSWHYDVVLPGYKCNMTDIQAAIGLHQLRKLPEFQRRRRDIFNRYNSAFCRFEELQVPIEREGAVSALHLYPIRLNLETIEIGRDAFIDELTRRNIGSSVHFIPLHIQPYFRDKFGFKPEDFPVSYGNFQRLITLPLHPGMSDDDVDDVLNAVSDIITRHRR